jgi:hypothetical protein
VLSRPPDSLGTGRSPFPRDDGSARSSGPVIGTGKAVELAAPAKFSRRISAPAGTVKIACLAPFGALR